MGQKLDGDVGSSAAELLNQSDSCNFPLGRYLRLGPAVVERSTRAILRDGHRLKIMYKTWSNGDGVDAIFMCLMADCTSSVAISSQ